MFFIDKEIKNLYNIVMKEREDVRCPVCGKLLAKKDKDEKIYGIYLYCKVCKKEINIDERDVNAK